MRRNCLVPCSIVKWKLENFSFHKKMIRRFVFLLKRKYYFFSTSRIPAAVQFIRTISTRLQTINHCQTKLLLSSTSLLENALSEVFECDILSNKRKRQFSKLFIQSSQFKQLQLPLTTLLKPWQPASATQPGLWVNKYEIQFSEMQFNSAVCLWMLKLKSIFGRVQPLLTIFKVVVQEIGKGFQRIRIIQNKLI